MPRVQDEPVLAAGTGFSRFILRIGLFLSITVLALAAFAGGQNVSAENRSVQGPTSIQPRKRQPFTVFPPFLVESGRSLFLKDCSFCHGRDAEGGVSGPDLTRSKLVAGDVDGSNIGPVVRNGRLDKGMPAFNFSETQMDALVAFIHTQRTKAETENGNRRGVDVADLQTGNIDAGKRYFYGAGGCSKCHSPTGDLAGIASRYQGLQLEERMLYPTGARSTIKVSLPSGKVVTGTLAYLDEFTVGLRDAAGYYRSWPVSRVKYTINSPVEAHVKLLGRYTDADIHNLMAYLQTLR